MARKQNRMRVVAIGDNLVAVARLSDEESESAAISLIYKYGMAVFNQYKGAITANYFANPNWRFAWQTFEQLAKEQLEIDHLSFEAALKKIIAPELVAETLNNIMFGMDSMLDVGNIGAYMENLANRYKAKQLQDCVLNAYTALQDPVRHATPDVTISELTKQLSLIGTMGVTKIGTKVGDLIDPAIARYVAGKDSLDMYSGLRTGYNGLDSSTMGWQKTDLIIIGGASSMGKTAFALSSLWETAQQYPDQYFYFSSMEMSAAQVTDRLVSIATGISLLRLRAPKYLTESDWEAIHSVRDKIANSNILIEDRVMSPEEMIAQWMRAGSQHPIAAYYLDYLQFCARAAVQQYGDERIAIAQAVAAFKAFAKNYANAPVILLSQVSREAVERCRENPHARPAKENFDGSSTIEKDADLCLIVHRPAVYFPGDYPSSQAECIIDKQRNGPTGIVPLTFLEASAHYLDPTANRTRQQQDWDDQ